ncbi:MAG: molybdopterin molybdotransferase MoeA [Actinomycetota bacterium]|nr:molybdopterin molybdotransferase MoeA [Actinomycetota bacterium]
MIPLAEARDRVLAGCRPLDPVTLPLADALGCVLVGDVESGELIPPFANTAMDGYALLAADTVGASADAPVELDVAGTVAAGAEPDVAVAPGVAVRIMTGAPLPPGADAIVMVELTEPLDGGARVRVNAQVPEGNHVRPAGDDVGVGDVVMRSGTTLSPAHLGVLASLGRLEVDVRSRPRVGVVSTGDELVEGPVPLRPGQIRDSNRLTLLALCRAAGFVPVDLGLVRDDRQLIEDALRVGVRTCDAVITSGGVSMGEFDYVKAVLDDIGDMSWMQVAIRPAKPLAFGLVDDVPVFGLPGNPVSSMVSFELFARPGLRKMMGCTQLDRRRLRAVAADGLARRPDGKIHFARVTLSADGADPVVRSAGGQGSHQLRAMADADALAVVPDGDGVPAGGTVEVIPLD